FHKFSGRAAVILGLIQPFQGLAFIHALPVLRVLYAVWFALVFALVALLSLAGLPSSSPVARWINRHLCKGRSPSWLRVFGGSTAPPPPPPPNTGETELDKAS